MNTGQEYLFPIDTSGIVQRHDYGGVLDGEEGHEFPFVQAGPGKSSAPLIQCEGGPSVSFKTRFHALESAARMYARYKRASGLRHAVVVPEYRADLEKRYDDVDFVAERAAENSSYSSELERAVLRPLLMEDALIQAGHDPADVDVAIKRTLYDVRQLIGVERTAAERRKNLRGIRRE